MLPPGLREIVGEIISKIVGEQDSVGAAEKKRGGPVPPSGQESPEIAERGAAPAIEATFHGHGRSEFGGHQRNRDAPEKWQDQQIQQRDARPRGGYHVLQAEGASGRVREHDEDEIKQSRLAEMGRFLGGQGLTLGRNSRILLVAEKPTVD